MIEPIALPTGPPSGAYHDRPWPAAPAARWAVRLVAALPFVVLALVADARDVAFPVHEVYLDRAALVQAGGVDLSTIGWAFPPVPVVIALVFESSLALSIAGALFAGATVHVVVERLAQRRVDLWLVVVLVAAVLGIPALWYGIMSETGVAFSLLFLAVAFRGYVRFVFHRDTDGGYVAGLALAVAALGDPAAVLYAAALAAATPLVARYRFQSEDHAARATALVLCFPTVLVVGSWMFLEWRFQGTVLVALRSDPGFWEFPDGVAGALWDAVTFTVEAVLRTPIFVVVGALLAWRRPVAVVGYGLPLAGMLVASFIGLPFDDLAALATLTVVAAAAVPYAPGPRASLALAAGAVCQWVINVVSPPDGPGVDAFLDTFF